MKVNYTYDGEYVQCLTDHLSCFTMVVLSDEGEEEEAMVNMLTMEDFQDCFVLIDNIAIPP